MACNTSTTSSLLALSGGQLAEMVVVGDKDGLDSLLELQVENALGKGNLQPGLPPPGEPKFNILFTDETFFKGYFKTHHNILVLLTLDNLDQMEPLYGENNRSKIEKIIRTKPETLGIAKENLWAENQRIFYLLAQDREDLINKLSEQQDNIEKLVFKNEQETGSRKLFTEVLGADSFYHKHKRAFGFTVRKPRSYRIAKSNQNITWLRKSSNTKEQDLGVLLFSCNADSVAFNAAALLEYRNSVLAKEIPGPSKGSYMGYSDVFEPYISETKLNGYDVMEIRGWWDVANDWMGGPSFIRVWKDTKNNRYIFTEGFVYYPNENKVKVLRELELILNSLKIEG
jgi:hypothetical protein